MMELTCSQTEMLLSFYFDGELKENLRKKSENDKDRNNKKRIREKLLFN